MINQKNKSVIKPFRSAEELVSPETSQINGEIPQWLRGTFIRTGPGKYDIDSEFTMNHLLDGYAILSKFVIADGTVSLTKKFVDSNAYKKFMVNKKPVVTEFGTRCYADPNKSVISRMWCSLIPELTDNTNIGWFKMGKDIFATNDMGQFISIDSCSLECLQKNDASKLFGSQIVTAHPMRDEEDGATYNVGISYLSGLKYNIIKIPDPSKMDQDVSSTELFKQAKTICSIPTRTISSFSLVHSFGMTKNYIIFIEQPLVASIKKVLANMVSKGHGFFDWIEWKPELKNKFIIIEKATGKVIKTDYISQDPFFHFHYANCYEEDEHLVLDISVYPNNNILENQYLDQLRLGKKVTTDLASIHRYVIPIIPDLNRINCSRKIQENIDLVKIKSSAKAVRQGNKIILTPEILTKEPVDFPKINDSYIGKSYRYFYGSGGIIPNPDQHKLFKFDCSKKSSCTWSESEHQGTGEPLFLKNPQGTSEDDGILVSAVTDGRDSHNDFLLFLDAKSMKELGRAQFQASIPLACHGIFLPDETQN